MPHLSKQFSGLSRSRKARRGSTMVEFGLVGATFLLILLGIADFSQFLFVQQAIVDRARAAARWGAVTDPTNGDAIKNMVLYLQPTVPPGGATAFGLTPSVVTVSTAEPGTDNYRLVVQISGYSYQVLSPFLAHTYQGRPVTVSVPLGLFQ
jgi:Flp pilus assembly protein TadG